MKGKFYLIKKFKIVSVFIKEDLMLIGYTNQTNDDSYLFPFKKCSEGYYWQIDQMNVLTSSGSCVQCPPGQIKPNNDYSICSLCPHGSYSDSSNPAVCYMCKEDQFCPSGIMYIYDKFC